jgi:hypothetical protein
MGSRRGRWAALAVTIAAILAGQAAIQVVAAPPAAAIPGLTRRTGSSVVDSSRVKTATALCLEGRVIGGGAQITHDPYTKVHLTHLRPVRVSVFGSELDGFSARAEEHDLGADENWGLVAYAICADADALPGYEITHQQTAESSADFQHTAAQCPGQKHVIGTGAGIDHANGQVGLQALRPADALDRAHATAHEDPSGYGQTWSLHAWAICADRIESAAVYTKVVYLPSGSDRCPGDKFVHSVGGGGGLVEDSEEWPVFLHEIYPGEDLKEVTVKLDGFLGDGLAVEAVCAY